MKSLFFHVLTIGVLLTDLACAQSETVNVTIDASVIESISAYHPGITHTQYSIDDWGNSTAIRNAKLLLDSVSHFQNQHIMGWGADNPWPDSSIVNPDNWRWESLDARMKLIRETDGVAVITLCGVPTWMHSPVRNGDTDWSALETAPTKSHFDDFAHLCAEVARRYPDVQYFQVWNEMKGFYYAPDNRWNYEDYTIMYNMVYDSLKAVNPDLKIGGPYVVMDSWSVGSGHRSGVEGAYGTVDQRSLDVITYWLQRKKGAEFITIDGGNQNRDGIWSTDHFSATAKFEDVIRWIQEQPGGETLPVWWAEWYAYPSTVEPHGDASHEERPLLNAVMASGLINSIRSGYTNLMIWQPQGDAAGYSFPLGIWTSTAQSGGGQATLFYHTQKMLKDHFSAGTKLFRTKVSQPASLAVLAGDQSVLLVNQLNQELSVQILGITEPIVVLLPYEVRLLEGVEYSDAVVSAIAQAEDKAFSIYPNPASDTIYIQASQHTENVLTLDVYAMNGEKVLTETMQRDTNGSGLFAASLRSLEAGTYLIKIQGLKGVWTQLISKD